MKSCNLGKWCMSREVCVVLPLAALPPGHSLPHVPTLWHEFTPSLTPHEHTDLHVGCCIPQHAPKGDGIGDSCQVDVENC